MARARFGERNQTSEQWHLFSSLYGQNSRHTPVRWRQATHNLRQKDSLHLSGLSLAAATSPNEAARATTIMASVVMATGEVANAGRFIVSIYQLCFQALRFRVSSSRELAFVPYQAEQPSASLQQKMTRSIHNALTFSHPVFNSGS